MSKAPDRKDPRHHRRGFAIALALVSLVAFQWFVIAQPGGSPRGQTSPPGQSQPPGQGTPPGQTPPPFDVGEGSCDVDGVQVFWDAGFFDGSGTATVRSVTIADVAPSCEDADLTVTLRRHATAIDSPDSGGYVDMQTQLVENIEIDNGRVPVDFAPFVDASLVTNVYVELAGGTMPIPTECAGMQFKNYTVGSNDGDTIEGFQLSNLIYGLDGNDTISGGQQDDCIHGQGDNDVLRGSAGKDVLIAGPGNDQLFGEQGNDILYGGPGVNTLDGGPGVDTCHADDNDIALNCERIREYGQ